MPTRPAHEIALEALKDLLSRDYPGKGRLREYYFELSDIIRHYVEGRFRVRAPEMTTEEFLAALQGSDILNSAQKESLREFLSHCDMVKFAKYLPDKVECEASYGSATKFIEETKEVITEEARK